MSFIHCITIHARYFQWCNDKLVKYLLNDTINLFSKFLNGQYQIRNDSYIIHIHYLELFTVDFLLYTREGIN
ncbi:hypothetical protein SB6095_00099 [Klebsiella quasivariicola]|uniref:Uncharacterized protein n=1 Tax=Klebsiella quasivariicola TaxID=2026240 RepID=A0A8B4TQ59_9ENTR|nr:Uncharacterised protein [Klebsiella quasivariicola]SXD87218.1 Uncharacterised protein [Klebsiella quasivariicola]VGP68901.1 hypothetical protein SB6095_00099 [Klebsiella quasivariicola]